MPRIGPHEMLEPGTKVKCGIKIGHIVSAKVVPAIPSGLIVVHTVRFTEKYERWPRRRVVKLKKLMEYEVNYSAIETFVER